MKTVYVNFRNDKPHSPFMSGKYVKEISLPFLLIDDTQGMNICQALDDYNIPWIGQFNDGHTEHIPKDSQLIFPTEIITDTPMFSEEE